MHTVQQAAALWCPMVRSKGGEESGSSDNAGVSPEYRAPPYARCIGSACAMWRWTEPLEPPRVEWCKDPRAAVEPERPSYLPTDWTFMPAEETESARWLEPQNANAVRRKGICGLSGVNAYTHIHN